MLLKNSKGSIIIPIITTLAVSVGLVSYYFVEYYRIRRMGDFQLIYRANVVSYMSTVKTMLKSQASFVKTMKSSLNGDLWSCLNNPDFDCQVTGEQPFSLIADNGSDASPFYDSASITGFDFDFVKCNSFPSMGCPFRYELTWSAECASVGVCYSPGIIITGVVKTHFSFAKKIILNADNYKMMVRIR